MHRCDDASGRLELVNVALDGGAKLGIKSFAEVLGGNADAQACDGLRECGDVVVYGTVGRGSIEGVLSSQHLQHASGIP